MSMNLDLDQTALLELKNELNQIDQRLTDLTRVPIVSFSDEDDDFNDEEQEESGGEWESVGIGLSNFLM